MQLTRPDECSRHVIPIPMIITQHTSGFRYFLLIHLPDVGNTLEGGASQPDAINMLGGYAYMLTLAFAPLAPGVDNTIGGCALHTTNLSSPLYGLLHLKQHTVDHIDSGPYR
jgi:hypothetical protein